MIYTILLLGLLPALFLPDGLPGRDAEDEPDRSDEPMDETVDVAGLIGLDADDSALLPVVEDDVAEDDDSDGDALVPVVEDDVISETVPAPVIEDDGPGDAVDNPDAVLGPVIEDDVASDTPPDDTGGTLAPVIEDDVATGQADSNPLSPVQEDDISRQFVLQFDGEIAASPVEIFGFDPQSDTLRVGSEGTMNIDDYSVEIAQSDDALDTHVRVNGALIAVLRDSAGIPASAVVLTPALTMAT